MVELRRMINNKTNILPNSYDLAIIGGGIAGLNAAIHASKNGLSVVLFESRDLGGLSLNGGDLLFSELFRALKIYKNGQQLVKDPALLQPFDLQAVFNKARQIKKNYLSEYIKIFETSQKITVIEHYATIITPTSILAGDITYNVSNIILASGAKSREYILPNNLDASTLECYVKPHQLMTLKTTPKNLVVIGGSNIAFEIATFFSAIGTKTTLVARSDVLKSVDLEIRDIYLEEIQNKHLTVIRDAIITNLANHQVTIEYEGKTEIVDADIVIPAIGFETLDVKIGDEFLQSDETGIIVSAHCETNIPGIYAIGNANFYPKFSNRAIAEAYIAVNHIVGRKQSITKHSYVRNITGLVEYAVYGKSEEELQEDNIPYIKNVHRPVVINETNTINFYKILIHKHTHQILGLFMVGTNVNEQMNTLLLMLRSNANLDYINRGQVLSSSYLVAKTLADYIKELDVRVISENLDSFFQPKYDLRTKKIIGAESLARFLIDDRFHNPMPFITNFEERGHIYEMDMNVLERALDFLHALKIAAVLNDDFFIAVNIAPYTLSQVSIEKIMSMLKAYDIAPKHIIFEVTERNFEEGFDFLEPMRELKRHGFKISMDDFSVGHSSFALLSMFDFDEIKLDLGLLPKTEHDYERKAIYKNIVDAVRTKDVKLVAEGIETEFHLDFLKKLGINIGQGYFLSRPLSRTDFIKLLKEGQNAAK